MPKMSLSDRELVIVWDTLRGPVWGGDAVTLLLQDELWTALGLDTRFAKFTGATLDMSQVSDELHDYELQPEAVGLLRTYLSRSGQPRLMGRHSASALKRLQE